MHFAFKALDYFYDGFGVLRHVFFEGEVYLELFFLQELHITRLEEVGPYFHVSLDGLFVDFPFGDPLASVVVGELDIFAGEAKVDVQLFPHTHVHSNIVI